MKCLDMMVVCLHSRVKKISVALQITGLWLNLHFLLCWWTFKSDLQAGEEELLLVAMEQVHIPASGPLMLDLQRKCQHVSLTEIKVWKVEPTLPNTPRQYAQRFCTKSWATSGTACMLDEKETLFMLSQFLETSPVACDVKPFPGDLQHQQDDRRQVTT